MELMVQWVKEVFQELKASKVLLDQLVTKDCRDHRYGNKYAADTARVSDESSVGSSRRFWSEWKEGSPWR